MFKCISNLLKKHSISKKIFRRIYSYTNTATINQLKKGLIDYILDDIYDLSYCRDIFICNDKQELIRYIKPLLLTKPSSNDYYRDFNEFIVNEYYFTPFFDEDSRNDRIIKTKSQISLNNIESICFFYSLRYGFDVYELYRFMDNNRYKEIDDDDIEETIIKITDFNDNLRVIIAPIYPQKRKSLQKGDYIDIGVYNTMKHIPISSYTAPFKFNISKQPFHYKLPFDINITEKIDNNIFIDSHIKRVVITGLSIKDIYRIMYMDRICYELGIKHLNSSVISSPFNHFLLIDDIDSSKEYDYIIDYLTKYGYMKNNIPVISYNIDINRFDKKTLLNNLQLELFKHGVYNNNDYSDDSSEDFII